MTTQGELNKQARALASTLRERQLKVVFAESCTGGLVSASLTRIPGISEYLCGSAVVYRVGTKAEWLNISSDILHKPGPVSRVVAVEMAKEVLDRTPEADLAASITGHLGPDAPQRLDGLVYVAVVSGRRLGGGQLQTVVKRQQLASPQSRQTARAASLRPQRQMAAAALVLSTTRSVLEKTRISR